MSECTKPRGDGGTYECVHVRELIDVNIETILENPKVVI